MTIYEDEIDLRNYLSALIRYWWVIVIITGIFAGAALIFSLLQPVEYDSSATILISRARSSLELANQFPTINEPIDSSSRIDAMLEIIKSDGLILQVAEDVQNQLPEDGIEREKLKQLVNITSKGDTIKINATYSDPSKAAVIANSWAQKAVEAINYAYSDEQNPGEINLSLQPAREEYETSQKDLEDFLSENKVNVLQKQIDETSTLLDELVQDRTWKIAYNVRRKQKMEQVINEAETLSRMLQSRQSSLAAGLGDALAVMRLRAEAFGELNIDRRVSSSGTPDSLIDRSTQETIIVASRQPGLNFDVQIAELIESVENGQRYGQDLAQIIAEAEIEKERAEEELLLLTQQSLDVEVDELVSTLSTRLRDLHSQLEAETAQLNDLTSSRDLSWNAYQALAQKETEVRNNLLTSRSVTLASPAVPPVETTGRDVLRNTAVGAALGFFSSVLLILLAEWYKSLGKDVESNQKP